jgi:hypothetical protein
MSAKCLSTLGFRIEPLAGDVRYFASYLPPVLTGRQRLAAQFIKFAEKQRQIQREGPERDYPKDQERAR